MYRLCDALQGQRVSAQVHRMLCKSKSRGDAKLRMEDRFFVEARCCCCGSDDSAQAGTAAPIATSTATAAAGDRRHYLYFSRLATAGRALDAVVAAVQHAQCESFAHGSEVELIVERTGAALAPLTRALSDFGSDLQCYDCVMVAPRGTAAAATAATPLTDAVSAEAAAGTTTADAGVTAAGAAFSAAVNSVQTAVEQASAAAASQADTAALTAAAAAATKELTAVQCTVTVMHGKTSHAVLVSPLAVEQGDAPPTAVVSTVLQLKRALESLTSVPFTRQKLMLKGKLLKDEQLLVQAGVTAGSKITLLGTAASTKT
jgi:Ubiquitin family